LPDQIAASLSSLNPLTNPIAGFRNFFRRQAAPFPGTPGEAAANNRTSLTDSDKTEVSFEIIDGNGIVEGSFTARTIDVGAINVGVQGEVAAASATETFFEATQSLM
jgi:hypothetical protein